MGSQILAFQCDREFFACSLEFNACHDKSIGGFLTCSVCLLMMGSECVGLWRGFKFAMAGLLQMAQSNVFNCTYSGTKLLSSYLLFFNVRNQYTRLCHLYGIPKR